MPCSRPLVLFDYIFYKQVKFMSKLCFLEILNENIRFGPGTVIFLLSMCIAIVLSVITVLTSDVDTALNSSTSWGIVVQGLVKYIVFLLYYKRIRLLVEKLRLIFVASDRNGMSSRKAILLKWSIRFVQIQRAFSILILLMIGLFVIYPLPIYLWTGIRVLQFPIYIPYIDITTTSGYLLTVSVHTFWLLQAAVGVLGSDVLIFAQILHLLPMVEIFEESFNEMNRALDRSSDKVKNSEYVSLWMRNLVQMHEEYSSYVKELFDIYRAVFFFDVNANGLGLMMCIAAVLVTNWLPIYVLSLVAVAKLFMICFMGTLVEVSANKVQNAIQSSNWYLLPVRLQKYILLMMAKSQRATILRAGTVPLNLDTFVNVLKNVYTVVMLLLESIA